MLFFTVLFCRMLSFPSRLWFLSNKFSSINSWSKTFCGYSSSPSLLLLSSDDISSTLLSCFLSWVDELSLVNADSIWILLWPVPSCDEIMFFRAGFVSTICWFNSKICSSLEGIGIWLLLTTDSSCLFWSDFSLISSSSSAIASPTSPVSPSLFSLLTFGNWFESLASPKIVEGSSGACFSWSGACCWGCFDSWLRNFSASCDCCCSSSCCCSSCCAWSSWFNVSTACWFSWISFSGCTFCCELAFWETTCCATASWLTFICEARSCAFVAELSDSFGFGDSGRGSCAVSCCCSFAFASCDTAGSVVFDSLWVELVVINAGVSSFDSFIFAVTSLCSWLPFFSSTLAETFSLSFSISFSISFLPFPFSLSLAFSLAVSLSFSSFSLILFSISILFPFSWKLSLFFSFFPIAFVCSLGILITVVFSLELFEILILPFRFFIEFAAFFGIVRLAFASFLNCSMRVFSSSLKFSSFGVLLVLPLSLSFLVFLLFGSIGESFEAWTICPSNVLVATVSWGSLKSGLFVFTVRDGTGLKSTSLSFICFLSSAGKAAISLWWSRSKWLLVMLGGFSLRKPKLSPAFFSSFVSFLRIGVSLSNILGFSKSSLTSFFFLFLTGVSLELVLPLILLLFPFFNLIIFVCWVFSPSQEPLPLSFSLIDGWPVIKLVMFLSSISSLLSENCVAISFSTFG